ncbi:hypothetical protein RZS08_62965, partial [Arthrospira platensis SPKY1]|nr:hypothetical protein [Arthrospira platensis SPKY1]
MNRRAGRHVPVSCNNMGIFRNPVEQVFDYWMGELSPFFQNVLGPGWLYNSVSKAHEMGKHQHLTMP